MLVIFIMVLMITYAVYIKYYPYIFIEVTTKKDKNWRINYHLWVQQ